MTRGVLYMTWAKNAQDSATIDALLERSHRSLRSHHPDLPVTVASLDPSANLLDKARMFNASPYDQTLFLDLDTVVCGNLDFGFEKAEKHSIAVCICECPWARRYGGLKHRGDMREFNTGVIFFDRSAAPIFDRWGKIAKDLDSSIVFNGPGGVSKMPLNDQASFAAAVDESDFNPFVLPLNWNFRPKWQRTLFGPLKIWHDYDDPPTAILNWSDEQAKPDAILDCARLT